MPPRTQQNLLWSLIEIPDDLGVFNVGGRLGAAGGPDAFWQIFAKMNGKIPLRNHLASRVRNPSTESIETSHRTASELISEATQRAPYSIVVGGGHDHGYSQILGIRNASPKASLGCINIDAHLDVRKPAPKITSGSPFYLAIESGILKPQNFLEFGIQSQSNSPELYAYIKEKKVATVEYPALREPGIAVKKFKEALKKLELKCDEIILSLDLDALAQAYCPGVSAPQAEGFTPQEIFAMMEIAAQSKKTRSLGIFELNPLYDIDHKTARVAATAAWRFIETKISKS